MKTTSHLLVGLMCMCAAISCNKNEMLGMEPKQTAGLPASQQALVSGEPVSFSQLNTAQVYFDRNLYTIQLKRVIDEPVNSNSPNKTEPEPADLFVYDVRTDIGPIHKTFTAVTSAVGAPGNTTLWREMRIQFNPGSIPYQFTSAYDVRIAAQGVHPIITLMPTGVVYIGGSFALVKQSVGREQAN